jgi:hypothetical protein
MPAYPSSSRSCAHKHARSPSLGPRLTCSELATLPCHLPRTIQLPITGAFASGWTAGVVPSRTSLSVSRSGYPKTVGELVLLIAVTAIALAGTLVRSRRAELAALRDRAAALERERLSGIARAAEERLRIASDVHDLVGHGLSGIAVQSSTARLALEAGRIELVRVALPAVEVSSRAALGEMRQLLSVLRAGSAAGSRPHRGPACHRSRPGRWGRSPSGHAACLLLDSISPATTLHCATVIGAQTRKVRVKWTTRADGSGSAGHPPSWRCSGP